MNPVEEGKTRCTLKGCSRQQGVVYHTVSFLCCILINQSKDHRDGIVQGVGHKTTKTTDATGLSDSVERGDKIKSKRRSGEWKTRCKPKEKKNTSLQTEKFLQ